MRTTTIRVLFITTAYPAHADDARGNFIHELARGLVAEGVEVTLLAPGAPGAPASEVRDGVHVHRARYWFNRGQALAVGLGGIVPNLRHKPWLAVQIPTLIAALTWHALRLARDTDVVHAHWVYPSGLAGLAAARRYRKPLVLTSHGGDLNLAVRAAPLRYLTARVARAADTCIGVSNAMASAFARLGVPLHRIRTIPLGVSVDRLNPSLALTRSPHATDFANFDGLRIVYAGSLIPRKSVHTVLEAQRHLLLRGHSVACMLIGDGPCEKELRALSRRTPAMPVVFVGEQPPHLLASYIGLGQVLVLPSRSEGLGLVLVQAMALGMVVVASDIEGPRELIEDGRTGLLFRPGDSEALATQLERILTAPSYRLKLGSAARSAIEQHHTIRGSALAHAHEYRSLTESAPVGDA